MFLCVLLALTHAARARGLGESCVSTDSRGEGSCDDPQLVCRIVEDGRAPECAPPKDTTIFRAEGEVCDVFGDDDGIDECSLGFYCREDPSKEDECAQQPGCLAAGVCTRRGAEGWFCNSFRECEGELLCNGEDGPGVGGVCAPRKNIGETCGSTFACKRDGECDGAPGELWRWIPLGAEGEECKLDGFAPCQGNMVCARVGTSPFSVCTRQRGVPFVPPGGLDPKADC